MNKLDAERASLRREVLAKSKILGFSKSPIAIGSEHQAEGSYIDVRIERGQLLYELGYSERGFREVRATSIDRDFILRRAFEGATQWVASEREVKARRAGEDHRRQLFDIQARLMGELSPGWEAPERERQAELLKAHPFDDAPSPWMERLPEARGRIATNESLAPFTWLRVGGPADVLFLPADLDDLISFVSGWHHTIPLTTIGVGSNLLVRDGGVPGVVIRLGRAFANIEARPDGRVFAGASALDAQVAKAAAKAGIAGLEFFSGIPGTIGGACVMNAGCYGSETKDVLVEAYAVNPWTGRQITLSNAEMKYGYRRSYPGPDEHTISSLVFTGALFQGRPDDPAAIEARMNEITARREQTQPIREKTGGSTFKNPPGNSSWKLVDEAGWRGKPYGGAMFSPLHANFLINTGEATAADLEGLGEAVRADVKAKSGVELEWEIKRIGRP